MSTNGNGTLPQKQQRFVDEYLIDLNATKAYARAYDVKETSARAASARLLANVSISKAIAHAAEERTKNAGVTVERVLKELTRMAWVDIAEAYDENGALKPIHDIPEDIRRAIVSIEVDEIWEWRGSGEDRERIQIGETKKIKLADKKGSNELLGKYLKMFIDQMEHTASGTLAELLKGLT